jgi:hypothetical protein
MPSSAAAQDHPVMSNVVPDRGAGAIEGKVQSVDTTSRKVTIAPKSGNPVTLLPIHLSVSMMWEQVTLSWHSLTARCSG